MNGELAVTFEENARPICTLALGCFCEIDGPTIVWSTQAFPSSTLVMLEDASASTSAAAFTPGTPFVQTPRKVPHSGSKISMASSSSSFATSPIGMVLSGSAGVTINNPAAAAGSPSAASSAATSLVFVPRSCLHRHVEPSNDNADTASESTPAPTSSLPFVLSPPETPGTPGSVEPSLPDIATPRGLNSGSSQPQQVLQPNPVKPGHFQVPTAPQPASTPEKPASAYSPGATGPSTTKIECPLCSSLPETQGFVSADEATDTVFVSKRTIAESYTVVRQACIRALSCEWSPKEKPPEGSGLQLTPVLYGNSTIGFSLSFLFRVMDSLARGSGRWYAIVTTWQDPMYLMAIACSGLLSVAIEPLVRDIQTRAIAFNKRENSMRSSNVLKCGPSNGGGGGTGPQQPQFRSVSFGGGGNNPGVPQSKHRSLAKITGLQPTELFRRFHIAFCSALLSVDRKLFIPGPKCAPQYIPARVFQYPPPGVFSNVSQDETTPGSTPGGIEESDPISAYGIDAPPTTEPPPSKPFVFSEFLEKLGNRGVRTLLYNAAVGNQIVVKAPREIASAAVVALSELLPEALRGTVNVWSRQYLESWECRFLGMPEDGVIPVEDLGIAAQSANASQAAAQDPSQAQPTPAGDALALGSRAVVTIHANGDASITGPSDTNVQLVQELRDALHSTLLSQVNTDSKTISSLVSLRLQLVHERWLTKAKLVTSLRAQGAFNTEANIAASLELLGMTMRDLPVVQFWAAAVRSAMSTLEAQAESQERYNAQQMAASANAAGDATNGTAPVAVPLF